MRAQHHVSALNAWASCGEWYRRRYIEGERSLVGSAAHVGTAVDRTVRADLQAKIEEECLLEDEYIPDLARDNFAVAWDGGVILAGEEAEIGAARAKGRNTDKAIRLAKLHHSKLAPSLQPVAVADRFVLDLKGYDFQLAGEIDVREADTIRDTKARAKSPSKNEAANSLQLTMYGLAAFVRDGALPKTGAIDVLVDNATPVVRTVTREYHRQDFDPLMERIAAMDRSIKAGVFAPADPSTQWKCAAAYCSYWPTCRFALRPVSVPVLIQIEPRKEAA